MVRVPGYNGCVALHRIFAVVGIVFGAVFVFVNAPGLTVRS